MFFSRDITFYYSIYYSVLVDNKERKVFMHGKDNFLKFLKI